jgi:limonene-1,2-epoxide hydrolase
MTERKRVVERYIDGFRRTDRAQILSCLTDDIVWNLHGYKTIRGKDAFDAEIEARGSRAAQRSSSTG